MMARMMARIYRSLDILSRGQLVEVDRSGLVAGYVGQTALKTQKVIEKAMGGVLFIDEAYALNGRCENDFGQEAIDTILKAMEDHRDDLVVIVAGYTDLMDRFIHSNPAWDPGSTASCCLRTIPPTRWWRSSGCSAKKGCYRLTEDARPLVRDYIAEETADDSFGNARGVRNLFEHTFWWPTSWTPGPCRLRRRGGAHPEDGQRRYPCWWTPLRAHAPDPLCAQPCAGAGSPGHRGGQQDRPPPTSASTRSSTRCWSCCWTWTPPRSSWIPPCCSAPPARASPPTPPTCRARTSSLCSTPSSATSPPRSGPGPALPDAGVRHRL